MDFSIYDHQYMVSKLEHTVPKEIDQIVMERTGHEMNTKKIVILTKLTK